MKLLENISWLGHDGFRITSGKTIYIDPYEIREGPAADLVLVTHAHYDHCSPKDIEKIAGPDTVIITEADSALKCPGNVKTVKPGDTVEMDGISIRAVPAYNLNKTFHPRKNGWLGFILEIGGVRVYHAGDTDFIPEMNDMEVDIALLPVSGTYVMTAGEAVRAAKAIGPKVAIPMHFGAIVGSGQDAEEFRRGLDGQVEVRILEKE